MLYCTTDVFVLKLYLDNGVSMLSNKFKNRSTESIKHKAIGEGVNHVFYKLILFQRVFTKLQVASYS